MLKLIFFLLQLTFLLSPSSSPRPEPFAIRISCGARTNIQTPPTSTLWFKDYAYTGGRTSNATTTSYISPPLKTLRYFPTSDGPNNCYNVNRIPKGHYQVRIFFGLSKDPNFDNTEPQFDVSMEGTQVYSLEQGWSQVDDQAFVEALLFVDDGTLSICFHTTGHGDPAVLSIEILQIDDNGYRYESDWSRRFILRTAIRLSCGTGKPGFGEDYNADHWGGDRFWGDIRTFGQSSDKAISTENKIHTVSVSPNFYPERLYQTALVSTDSEPDLSYTIEVNPNRNYSVWLHFAEIDSTIREAGQRVFDILINGDIAFTEVDVIKMSGDRYTALVLNRTVPVNGRSLNIALHPTTGGHAIINAIEVFEVIPAESRTAIQEGKHAYQDLTFGLDNQGLRGFLPNDISKLRHLQSINLSGNSIQGAIPVTLGNITSLETLDLSFNEFNGSIPESLGQLTSLQRLNLNSNFLSGKVPATLGGRLVHRASFNFTTNSGLCGIPGLRTCGPHLSTGAKIGIALGVFIAFLLIMTVSICWWKRRENILRTQRIAARDAPYAKARTHFVRERDVQMGTRTATEHGPTLLS
ncbi:Receptor-like protein 4 [Ranunculus cassubicifolius]